MVPSTRLLVQARALRRTSLRPSSIIPSSASPCRVPCRLLTSTAAQFKWTGSGPEDHIANEADTHEIHHDAAREGKREHAKGAAENKEGQRSGDGGSAGGGSSAATERSGGANEKAKKDYPEAPDTIGMQDERG